MDSIPPASAKKMAHVIFLILGSPLFSFQGIAKFITPGYDVSKSLMPALATRIISACEAKGIPVSYESPPATRAAQEGTRPIPAPSSTRSSNSPPSTSLGPSRAKRSRPHNPPGGSKGNKVHL